MTKVKAILYFTSAAVMLSSPAAAGTGMQPTVRQSSAKVNLNADSVELNMNGIFAVIPKPEGYTAVISESRVLAGMQLSEILQYLPYITLENGTYSINAVPARGIYLNGQKISGYEELDNIPYRILESVDVTYSAGSGNSPEDVGGAIRITTKKTADGRLSGSLNTDMGVRPGSIPADFNISSVLEYRKSGTEIFNYMFAGLSDNFSTSREESYPYPGAEGTALMKKTEGYSYKVTDRMGIRHRSGRNTAGLNLIYVWNNSNPHTETGHDVPTFSTNIWNSHEFTASAFFTREFGRKGYSVTLNAEYGRSDESSHNTSGPVSEDGTFPLSEDRTHLGTDSWSASVSLNIPVNRAIGINTGLSADCSLSGFRMPEHRSDPETDNVPAYVHTVGLEPRYYITANGIMGNFSYKAGINLQSTMMSYRDMSYRSFRRQYGISPTVNVGYRIDGRNRVNLIYRRSLGEMPYEALVPYMYTEDNITFRTGNPDLKVPHYDMVNLRFDLLGNRLSAGILFYSIRNSIYSLSSATEDGTATVIRPVNLNGTIAGGLDIEGNARPFRWWYIRVKARAELLKENSTISGMKYEGLDFKSYLTASNAFAFRKDFGISIDLFWEPTYTFYGKTYFGVYAVTGSAYKTFCDGRFKLTLDFTTFANGRMVLSENTDGSFTKKLDTTARQYLGISFNWIFNSR